MPEDLLNIPGKSHTFGGDDNSSGPNGDGGGGGRPGGVGGGGLGGGGNGGGGGKGGGGGGGIFSGGPDGSHGQGANPGATGKLSEADLSGSQSLGEGSWAPGSATDVQAKPDTVLFRGPGNNPNLTPEGVAPSSTAAASQSQQFQAPQLSPGPGINGFYGQGFSPFRRGNW